MVTVHWPLASVTQLPLSVLGGWAVVLMKVMVEAGVPGTRVKVAVWPAKPTGPEPVFLVSVMVNTWSVLTLLVDVPGETVRLKDSKVLVALPFTVSDPESRVVMVQLAFSAAVPGLARWVVTVRWPLAAVMQLPRGAPGGGAVVVTEVVVALV